jgi:hypothetical protein
MLINYTKEQQEQQQKQQHALKHYCSQQRAHFHLLNSVYKNDRT